jgi:hypothetical protein
MMPFPVGSCSDAKVTNRNVRDFGWEIARPVSLDTSVARTHMYTYAAKFWDLSLVQGHFLSFPCQTLASNSQRSIAARTVIEKAQSTTASYLHNPSSAQAGSVVSRHAADAWTTLDDRSTSSPRKRCARCSTPSGRRWTSALWASPPTWRGRTSRTVSLRRPSPLLMVRDVAF